VTAPVKTDGFRIGELAAAAGVSVATVKYYIREGLLPPPPVKTGRTMAYYDAAYLERLKLIRRLREDSYFPIKVIKAILAEWADGPLAPGEAAALARLGPRLLDRLSPAAEGTTRGELRRQFGLGEGELAILEETGLLGEDGRFTRDDVELLEAFRRAEQAGLTRDRFPMEGVGSYVELLGELARREVRRFTHQLHTFDESQLLEIAERALHVTEPIVTLIRRKLILRALRAELAGKRYTKTEEEVS
jgi:DNA-binding transcriptional MerR regulator